MKKQSGRGPWLFFAGFFFWLAASPLVPPSLAQGDKNPIREEMMLLDSAFKTIIDGVVLGNFEGINPALAKVQDARARLKDALKAGYRISLPKNQKRLGDFFSLSDQLHVDLAELASAAETGQKKVVKNFSHRLLDTCVGCHERFRK
jgi:hypothetical protein